MEDTPRIIMQCPKCLREYSPDTSYCDSCSVMLEPVEITAPDSSSETGKPTPPDNMVLEENNQLLDDIKIDSLKTGIELTFARTLLLELTQLKKRLSLKEHHPLAKGAETNDTAFEAGINEATSGVEYIYRKIAKLEAILHNLEKKIEADISDLQTRLQGLKRPGLLDVLTHEGRIYRMLSSELNTKLKVLKSIQSKIPPSPFEKFLRPSPVTVIAVVAMSAIVWTVFSATQTTQNIKNQQSSATEGKMISRNDIISLLEDIKTANLHKDLPRWESRYSKNYLAMEGKKENIQGLWNSFDYLSLDYRIDQIHIQQETANAMITWSMKLRSKKTGEIINSVQTLSADFVREDKTFKISAVRKKEL